MNSLPNPFTKFEITPVFLTFPIPFSPNAREKPAPMRGYYPEIEWKPPQSRPVTNRLAKDAQKCEVKSIGLQPKNNTSTYPLYCCISRVLVL